MIEVQCTAIAPKDSENNWIRTSLVYIWLVANEQNLQVPKKSRYLPNPTKSSEAR